MNEKNNGAVRKRLTKSSILTVPNLLTCIRLILIPVIIVLYAYEKDFAALAVILISSVTDIADGIIARKFNMISDIGKVLDPIADKLTQGTVCICLATRHPIVWVLVVVLAVKETIMFLMGCVLLKVSDVVPYSRWYGKACTVITEASIMLFVLWNSIPDNIALIVIDVCISAIFISFILYVQFYADLIKGKLSKTENEKKFLFILSAVKIVLIVLTILFFIAALATIHKFPIGNMLK